ncbi:MAG TPA: hypothetical protein PLM14_08980 [Candidatus Hydrogenedentes bacterium]|nr:hypothetical protein [Candidatus Hydrogenedentota bacterium]HQH54823.1 hypothetical protein [Candidatus Hydrogenedentota bacterium]
MNRNTDPLAIIPEAFRAIVGNPRALGLYAGLTMGVSSVKLAVMYALTGSAIPEDPELSIRLLEFCSDLVLAGVWAFAQTVAFSWMGQDLDRPLWRIRGIGDAMKRFFSIWLMLNLLIIMLGNVAGKLLAADNDDPTGQFMLLLFLVLQVIAIPVGAAIMFHGELKWKELGQSLAPLGRQLFSTLLLVGFSGCALVVILFFLLPATVGHLWARPLIDIPGGLADCVVFAATWAICIMDRESEDTTDDFDF